MHRLQKDIIAATMASSIQRSLSLLPCSLQQHVISLLLAKYPFHFDWTHEIIVLASEFVPLFLRFRIHQHEFQRGWSE